VSPSQKTEVHGERNVSVGRFITSKVSPSPLECCVSKSWENCLWNAIVLSLDYSLFTCRSTLAIFSALETERPSRMSCGDSVDGSPAVGSCKADMGCEGSGA
jgi:hypothetical protein